MANYSVVTYQTEDKQFQKVASDLETRIETIDTTKTIRLYGIAYRSAEDTFVGTLVYDA